MSVVVTAKLSADVGVVRKSSDERAEECQTIAGRARENGAVSHRFAVGDGFVLVNDERESVAAFENFFGDPEAMAFIGSVGADLNVVPETTVGESIDSPDTF